MLQPGRVLDLAQEALGPERGGQLGVQHLERDRAVVPEVVGEVHRGHAAAPELALEPVAVSKTIHQALGKIGQRSGSPVRRRERRWFQEAGVRRGSKE